MSADSPARRVADWAHRIWGPGAHTDWANAACAALLAGREPPRYPGLRPTGAARLATIRQLLDAPEGRHESCATCCGPATDGTCDTCTSPENWCDCGDEPEEQPDDRPT